MTAADGSAVGGRDASGWAGHPRGLSTLFFTEMWERFSYYGMRAFLILYMVHALGFDDPHAGSVYGTYTGSVWFAAIFGGIIADRWLGHYRSVLVGGIIIALGHFTLALHALPFFYAGLSCIVIGTGLLKPNVSTLVGSLYEQGDERRDAGFSIFYMGINLGAFLGPLIAGYLAQQVDWHLGFACAGVGMTLGLVQYIVGRQRLAPGVDRLAVGPTPGPPAPPLARRGGGGVHGRGLEAYGCGGGVLRVRDTVLGRIRAGGLDAQPVRRPVRRPHSVRPQALRVVVRLDPGPVRDHSRADLRVAVGAARLAPAVLAREVRLGAPVHGTRVPPPHAGRKRRPRWGEGEPAVVGGRLLHRGAGGVEPQPRWALGRDEACPDAGRRPDDGRVVPIQCRREQARRVGGRIHQQDAAGVAVRRDRGRDADRRARHVPPDQAGAEPDGGGALGAKGVNGKRLIAANAARRTPPPRGTPRANAHASGSRGSHPGKSAARRPRLGAAAPRRAPPSG